MAENLQPLPSGSVNPQTMSPQVIWRFAAEAGIDALDVRVGPDDSPRAHLARLITSTRLALAAFSLFALALHPIEPSSLGWFRLAVVISYGVYAALLARLASRVGAPPSYLRSVHAVDIGACFLFLSISDGIGSLFVPFFVFAVVAGGLRWQWRGTLWTSLVIVVFLGGMGAYAALSGHPGFEIHSFAIDAMGLAVTAGLVGRIGSMYGPRARLDVEKLVPPFEPTGEETDALLHRVAEWAASITGSPRVLIAWEDPDEPWLYLGWWDRGNFQSTQEPPGVMEPLVPGELAEFSFLCSGIETSTRPAVLYRSPEGFKRWRGAPLHPALQARFAPRSVLSLKLETDTIRGRLFFFDKPGMTMENLIFAEIVSRHIATRLTHVHLLRGSADRTVLDERLRLARELHDGALHSLAGMALELESLLHMPTFEPAATQRRVQEVQQSLLEEQRNIRQLIAQLRADTQPCSRADMSLVERLEELARRLKRQWGLRVECVLGGLDFLPARLSNEVYFVVHEALVNVARHANASVARLQVTAQDDRVTIVVADNGRGFEFTGRYDHAALTELDLGPATLKERVALLGGSLTIDSAEGGTRLEITLAAQKPAAL